MNHEAVRFTRLADLGDVSEVFHGLNIKSGARIQPTTGGYAVNQATPVHDHLTMNLWARKDIHCEERVSADCLRRHHLEDENPAVLLA